jgi:glutamyl-tRNA reductase
MAGVDIVVSSTGCPETILHREQIEKLMTARRNRPLFLIDIAVPRDIDPDVQHIENVYLYNIDDLEAIVRENVRHREQDLAACRTIIDHRATALVNKLAAGQENGRAGHRPGHADWLSHNAAVYGG